MRNRPEIANAACAAGKKKSDEPGITYGHLFIGCMHIVPEPIDAGKEGGGGKGKKQK